jgi:Cupin-like domain
MPCITLISLVSLPSETPERTMLPIPEIDNISSGDFRDRIVAGSRPAVIRGLVRNWPVVQAARTSAAAFCDYLKRFDRGYEVDAAFGPPSVGGRIFYNDDLSGLNCRMEQLRLSSALDYLLEHSDDDPAPTLAIQSVVISRYLPGMEKENRLSPGFLPDGVDGRIWLGTRAAIAAHFDPSENLACCVAGTRRFTLFPPEQVSNLYVGPFERTPAGAAISMVDFDRPDYAAYPRFAEAEAAAYVADLAPGDAVFIPYLWWHHVRSLEPVNGLVNFWWGEAEEQRGDPRNALLHAMMSIKNLPPPHRDAWRAMFEHYVFEVAGDTAAHLPEARRGILGRMEPEQLKRLRLALSRALSRN